MLLYVSGPYTGEIDRNIEEARRIGIELWEMGHVVIVPHLNTSHFERDCKLGYDDYIKGDLAILARCDGIVLTPRWEASNGAKVEYNFAVENKIPIWYYPEIPSLHPTELRCPKQVEGFMNTIMSMYRIHLAKNFDYSPANILATGEIGLTTRLWDKVARLMNLTGFRFQVIPEPMDVPKEPKHESIDDTLSDAAVYSVIGQLLRKGVWGQ